MPGVGSEASFIKHTPQADRNPQIASGLYKQVASDCVQKLPTDLEQRLVSAERGFPHNGVRRSLCVRNVRVVTHLRGMTEADATPRSQRI